MDEPCAIRTTEPMVVACMAFSGEARRVSEAFFEVAEWLRARELRPMPWIGVFQDARDPGTYVDPDTRQMSGEVWIPFEGEARGGGRIEVRRVDRQRVACALHRGDIATIGETVRELKEWVRRRGLRAAGHHRQVYLKVVPGEPRQSETEVQIPLV